MAKYDPLEDHLRSLPDDTWVVRFDEIERILGCRLPPTARRCAAWWSHQSPHSLAWLRAGWHVKNVDMPRRFVTFWREPSHG